MADTPSPSVNIDTAGPSAGGMPRTAVLPNAILTANLMSDTSKASDCFVGQKFSYKLQAFLIGYTNSIYSYYSVYK